MTLTNQKIPKTMKAIAIDRFGGIDELKLQTLPTPDVGPDDVLIRTHTAGVGVWDPMDREGFFAEMRDFEPNFPYILGGEGAGIVVAVGEQVKQFEEGDLVYGYGAVDPKAKFYAEYVAASSENVALVPGGLNLREAGTMIADAVTALCGLDLLHLRKDDTLLILGASGGVGHLAVQLAKRMGARVFAVASGEDGVDFVKQLGADTTINGYKDDIPEAARQFSPAGFDAALLTAGGDAAEQVLSTVHDGGHAAYPNGVRPVPKDRPDIDIQSYDGRATPAFFKKLNKLIEQEPFKVNIAKTFPLEEAAEAHRMLDEHFLGKLALEVSE